MVRSVLQKVLGVLSVNQESVVVVVVVMVVVVVVVVAARW